MQTNAFLIAGPKSNSGKTMITLGLLKALVDRGHKVQPFKCGPDYIDPMHHAAVAGVPSYNLDTFMSSEEHMKDVFYKQSKEADISIIEGVMGLFDGASRDKGSSAEISKLLGLPVILVVDAASTAYSIAPLLYGFKHFDKEVNIAGVIFNKVGSASHYSFLKDAADDVGVTSLGYIPKTEGLKMPSRHLGLQMPQDVQDNSSIELAASLIEQHIDIDLLLEQYKVEPQKTVATIEIEKRDKVFAIAKDEAFNFMYPANIDALKELGKVVFFSPMHDVQLPEADLIWLPGGYPELFAQTLSENVLMREQMAHYAKQGGAIVAECGGMMYLGKSLKSDKQWPMCAQFDYTTSTENMKLTLGYRKVEGKHDSLYGHEFHYSAIADNNKERSQEYKALSARGREVDMMLFKNGKIWSSYLHLYLGEVDKMKNFLTKELKI